MTLSLYQRLSLALCLVFIAIASVFYLWSERAGQQFRLEAQQRLHVSLAANLARDNPLLQQGIYDKQALTNLFHTQMVLGPAFEFYFVDKGGNIVIHSADDSLIKRQTIDLQPLLNLTKNQAPLPILGDDPRHVSRKKIFSAAPVFNGAALQGYLYVIVAGQRYDNIFNSDRSQRKFTDYLVLSISALLFLLLLMLGLFWFVTSPIRRLNRDIDQLIAASFDSSQIDLRYWQSDSDNEIQQLGCQFRLLVQKIDHQLRELTANDQQRRELLSHLSHDLRTPLTAMQGYIETLAIRDKQLTDDKRQEYMAIVLRNSKQLNMLIDQIFELAHLDTGQVSLDWESFNIGELLHDIAAKFHLQAEKHSVAIHIEPPQCQLSVHSDIGKLDRILTNLIENALRHSFAGGTISIEVENLGNDVQVSVIDTGTGIKKEEIAYIFEPRYRASNAIDNEHKHNGLGLAISKRLLKLLSIDIKVYSELGKGTRFVLTLAKPL
ncbi:HAMP domain-containing sensor histidine kinase [Thalassotalea sp. Y01]|uniref:sensor histidine kinase n=1 Tax=Thalassotalea sp. Y01 TaxID=2729613 RepID=UPI00145F4D48|nr:HAMP domain-containing sensor histidine kinase [Thalassotalea sp. Y01]NMP16388.1 HAMP domain-containing histidine kinase [Thalassotalea sp. Y01]